MVKNSFFLENKKLKRTSSNKKRKRMQMNIEYHNSDISSTVDKEKSGMIQ